MDDRPSLPAGNLIPVSLLTGFLGSGKTTVLNGLLRRPELARTVVIINEFGEIGLDHELVESSTEDMILLKSGCLCCTIRGDLVDALRGLMARRIAGRIAAFDRVLIETTGLADPAPILHTLMSDRAVASAYRLDGIITTVDAATADATLDRQAEAVKQVAVADRLLLTKTDLVTPEASHRLAERLKGLNPAAPILRARHGGVDPAEILDAGLFDPRTRKPDVQRWLNEEAYRHHHDHHHHHDVNRHDEHIKALCLRVEQPIRASAFETWLGLLLAMKGPDILRVKGIVNIAELPGPLVIHGVQHVVHPPLPLKSWPSADRSSRIVFITRDLDEAALRDTLRLFTDDPPAPSVAAS
ncbi:MAG: CobW family GTP-binding protein [Pseudomonadota bacterium]